MTCQLQSRPCDISASKCCAESCGVRRRSRTAPPTCWTAWSPWRTSRAPCTLQVLASSAAAAAAPAAKLLVVLQIAFRLGALHDAAGSSCD